MDPKPAGLVEVNPRSLVVTFKEDAVKACGFMLWSIVIVGASGPVSQVRGGAETSE